MANIPPLTKLVQKSMERLYPLALADQSWDNVGLLLEPPHSRERMSLLLPKVMLTIDLTTPVVMEALKSTNAVETIVTYRLPPTVFALLMSRPYHLSSNLKGPYFGGFAAEEFVMVVCCGYWGVFTSHES